MSVAIDAKPHFGFTKNMTERMLKSAGIKQDNSNKVASNKCNVAFAYSNDDSAEPNWVGPLSSMNWVLYARSDSSIKLNNLEDAKSYKIGGHNGDLVSSFLDQNNFNVTAVVHESDNLAKLSAGEIDLWAVYGGLAEEHARIEGYENIKPVLKVKTNIVLDCHNSLDEQTLASLKKATIQ